MQVEMLQTPRLFGQLADEWNALLHRSVVNTLFLTPEWQGVWWRHFGAGRSLWLLLARDESGILQGIAPLCAFEQDGQTVLQFVGGVDVSDYLDFVVSRGREEEVYRTFLDYLSHRAPRWDLLDLHCLPGQSPTGTGLLCQVCADCCPGGVSAEREEAAPYIPLPGDWESYLEALDKKQRHEVRRKMRRAEAEAEVRWERLQDASGLDDAVSTFIALHRASHPEKDAFMTPQMAGFFRDMAAVTWAAGWLNLYMLWLDGRPAAAMWCFDYGGDLLVYNSGYDPAYRPELSAGNVLLSYCIQDAIARGKRRFDFLRGGETYKYRLGAVDSAVYHLAVRNPRAEP